MELNILYMYRRDFFVVYVSCQKLVRYLYKTFKWIFRRGEPRFSKKLSHFV